MNHEGQATGASRTLGEDRLKMAATAMASNIKLRATQDPGQINTSTISEVSVQNIIKDWPTTPKLAAETTIKLYGPPNEATASMLIWNNNNPWKRTIVFREEVPHNFPEPHTDVLEQTIEYQVPVNKVGLVAQMDGSIVIDRTKGEVSVHCDNEGANILSLNMMHDVITGKRTPEEARKFIAKEIVKYLLNQPAPYAEQFQFRLPEGVQWDTDETIVQDVMLDEAMMKMKRTLGLH